MTLVNLPRKAEVLGLPPEPRALALSWAGASVCATGAISALTLCLIQASIWMAAHGSDGAPLTYVGIGLAVVAPLAVVAWSSVRIRALIDRHRPPG